MYMYYRSAVSRRTLANTNNFLIENWKEGYQPSPDLPFTAQPGRSPEAKIKLPEDPQPEDFVDLFLTNQDFMSMA